MTDLEHRTARWSVTCPDDTFAAAPGPAVAAARTDARAELAASGWTPAPAPDCRVELLHVPDLGAVRIDVIVPIVARRTGIPPADVCTSCRRRPRTLRQDVCDVCRLCREAVAALTPCPLERRETCGTRRGYQVHREAGEDACRPCRDAEAAYTRSLRARADDDLQGAA